MKILVTGATGFSGSYVIPLFLEAGHEVRCMVRPGSRKKVCFETDVDWLEGDLWDSPKLVNAMPDIQILVNIASLGFGLAPGIVKAAVAAGVERAVFISTTAIYTTLDAKSKQVRLNAEKTITDSGLAYTILRPTMIYGSRRDRNISRLIRFLQTWPFIPVFGSGENLQQPVFVGDVAKSISDVILNERTIQKSYNIPGAKAITFNDMIDITCKLMNRKVAKLHFPAAPVIFMIKFLEHIGIRMFIGSEQIMRLNEDKSFKYQDADRDFGYRPLSYEQGISLELKEMGYC